MQHDIYFTPSFDAWRMRARQCLLAGQSPAETTWIEQSQAQGSFTFTQDEAACGTPTAGPGPAPAQRVTTHVPKAFLAAARDAAAHRDPRRWSVLYRLLWRLTHEGPHLLEVVVDEDVALLHKWAQAVRRDIHKMHAFVRFRQLDAALAGLPSRTGQDPHLYLAWHCPDHAIVRLATPFFARRFSAMRWLIMTPDESAYWDGSALTFGPGCPHSQAPRVADALEDLWLSYYSAIFNPARIKLKMMQQEMPKRHWRTLPETAVIDRILADAPRRVEAMLAAQPPSVAALVPAGDDWNELRAAAAKCRGCPLHAGTTQTVLGRGPRQAEVVIVGEQPGDQEDRRGLPFIGPAGQILSQALAAAGLAEQSCYLTNAVKHFKHTDAPTKRLHQTPNARDIAACKPWLEAELRILKPRLLICLGASAAQAVLGRLVEVKNERGRLQRSAWAAHTLVTNHPAAILRTADPAAREAAYRQLVADLSLAGQVALSR